MLNAEKLKELVAKFPVPAAKDGKLAEVDKDATDAALAPRGRARRERRHQPTDRPDAVRDGEDG